MVRYKCNINNKNLIHLCKLVQQITFSKMFSSKKFIHLHVVKYSTTSLKIFSNVANYIFSIFCPCHQKMFKTFHSIHRFIFTSSQYNVISRDNVFGLSFHRLLIVFIASFASVCLCKSMFCQVCVFAIVSFAKCYFICLLSISFWQVFFWGTMVVILMKEARSIVGVDDLDFGIRDVAFEAKVFNRYGTFDQIANRNMEDPGYAYFHCDLLDRVVLTIIT